jgi:hypothetical protein
MGEGRTFTIGTDLLVRCQHILAYRETPAKPMEARGTCGPQQPPPQRTVQKLQCLLLRGDVCEIFDFWSSHEML